MARSRGLYARVCRVWAKYVTAPLGEGGPKGRVRVALRRRVFQLPRRKDARADPATAPQCLQSMPAGFRQWKRLVMPRWKIQRVAVETTGHYVSEGCAIQLSWPATSARPTR